MRIINLSIILTLFGVIFLSNPSPAISASAETVSSGAEKYFPGLNEVVPRATTVASRISETEIQIQQAEGLDDVYTRLDPLAESLKQRGELYSNWVDIKDWQLTRLLGAQGSYTDLCEQRAKPLETIFAHLAILENQHSGWEQEKIYWQEWQVYFKKSIKAPGEVFSGILSNGQGSAEKN